MNPFDPFDFVEETPLKSAFVDVLGLSPIVPIALAVGLKVALNELDGDLDPAVEAFLARTEEATIEFVGKLNLDGIA